MHIQLNNPHPTTHNPQPTTHNPKLHAGNLPSVSCPFRVTSMSFHVVFGRFYVGFTSVLGRFYVGFRPVFLNTKITTPFRSITYLPKPPGYCFPATGYFCRNKTNPKSVFICVH